MTKFYDMWIKNGVKGPIVNQAISLTAVVMGDKRLAYFYGLQLIRLLMVLVT